MKIAQFTDTYFTACYFQLQKFLSDNSIIPVYSRINHILMFLLMYASLHSSSKLCLINSNHAETMSNMVISKAGLVNLSNSLRVI